MMENNPAAFGRVWMDALYGGRHEMPIAPTPPYPYFLGGRAPSLIPNCDDTQRLPRHKLVPK